MADDSLTYRWTTPDDQGQGYSDPNAPGAPESVTPSMPASYVNPNLWGAVGRGAAALAGDFRDIGSALWQAGPGTIGDVWSGRLQPGTPEFNEAARNTAMTYGLPGGAPEESLSAGMRVRGRPSSLGGRRVDPVDEPLPELATPPPAMGGNRPPKTVKRVSPQEGGTLVPGGASFTQYAEKYPEVGPPVMTLDPKKGTMYPAKQLTPEAEAFDKARAKIMKDMKKKGYEPFFDPAQRFDVDPATHPPPNVDTSQILPKKQATIDAWTAKIDTPEARARLQEAYKVGSGMPNTANWYQMGQLEQKFIKELGPIEGPKAFRDKFAASMGATTGGSDPSGNLMMSNYLNYLRQNKLPYPTAAYETPVTVGGRYGMGNINMHEKVFDQGGYAGLGAENPKRHNFARDFLGETVPTMDEQMVSGMTPGVGVPPDNTYGIYHRVLAEEAAKAGVDPRRFQEVAWAGFKHLKTPGYTQGQPMIGVVNDAIERTHRLTGMPREEILRRAVIRNEIPLYAAGDISSAIASSAVQAAQQQPDQGQDQGAGP